MMRRAIPWIGVVVLVLAWCPTATAAQTRYTCFGKKATIVGTSHADVLRGTPRKDVIAGLGGNDVIKGLGGADLLCGFSGNDRVLGGGGNDRISGDEGDDTLRGDAGFDVLVGWGGDDAIDGGDDIDIASWFNAPASVTANLETGIATGEGSDTLADVENLEGGAYDDSLTGDDGGNWLAPGPGNDTVDGGAGLVDVVSYFFSETAVSVDLTAGTATGQGTDTLTGIEGANGSNLDDTLIGDEGSNGLYGSAGDDTLSGGDGDDSLNGEAGDDSLDGGNGTDIVKGGIGTDVCLNGEDITGCES
jgi:Ca2+-binding RTX toxin-like protein